MKHPHPTLSALALTAAITLPAQAASGQIDSFSASALSVTAGSTVDFFVQYSVSTTAWNDGGSNPQEPAPEEGYQSWDVNWYSYEFETLTSVWLQGGGQSTGEFPSVAPGSTHSGSWSFSVLFPTAGQFDVDVSVSWELLYESGYSNEVASRNCYYDDPETSTGLFCDSWSYDYPQADDSFTVSDGVGPATLRIEVLAAVPEPQTVALWLGGLALLGARARLTRR